MTVKKRCSKRGKNTKIASVTAVLRTLDFLSSFLFISNLSNLLATLRTRVCELFRYPRISIPFVLSPDLFHLPPDVFSDCRGFCVAQLVIVAQRYDWKIYISPSLPRLLPTGIEESVR